MANISMDKKGDGFLEINWRSARQQFGVIKTSRKNPLSF
jgi:hypothetical protein